MTLQPLCPSPLHPSLRPPRLLLFLVWHLLSSLPLPSLPCCCTILSSASDPSPLGKQGAVCDRQTTPSLAFYPWTLLTDWVTLKRSSFMKWGFGLHPWRWAVKSKWEKHMHCLHVVGAQQTRPFNHQVLPVAQKNASRQAVPDNRTHWGKAPG